VVAHRSQRKRDYVYPTAAKPIKGNTNIKIMPTQYRNMKCTREKNKEMDLKDMF
jgi:hypothetical protein